MRSRIIIAVLGFMLILGGAAVFVSRDILHDSPIEPTVPAEGTPIFKIEPVEGGESDQLPDLDRPINVTANLSESVAARAVSIIGDMTSELKKDSTLFSSWLELALQRKAIGDHTAAEEIWLYVTRHWPGDPIAYNNLADLYLTILHDNAKAETYLLEAIKKAPTQVIFYENAYTFYRFVKKDLTRAREVLEEGIAKNPENAEGLRELLADLNSAQ